MTGRQTTISEYLPGAGNEDELRMGIGARSDSPVGPGSLSQKALVEQQRGGCLPLLFLKIIDQADLMKFSFQNKKTTKQQEIEYRSTYATGWKKKQLEALFGDRCMICRKAKYTELHHKNKRHGDNRTTNLLLLCTKCHRRTDMGLLDSTGVFLKTKAKYSMKDVSLMWNGQKIKPLGSEPSALESEEKPTQGQPRANSKMPTTPTPAPASLARSTRVTENKLHHILYSAPIRGSFVPAPDEKEGRDYERVDMRNWPRPKYIYGARFGQMKKVVNLHCLEITFELDPLGERVLEKVKNSQETADRVAKAFCAAHSLTLAGSMELQRDKRSPHVLVGNKKIQWVLAPKAETRPDLNERSGYVQGDSSHPNDGEMKGPESIEAGKGLDDMYIDFPEQLPGYIDALFKGQIAFRQDVRVMLGAVAENTKRVSESMARQDRITELLTQLLSKEMGK